MLLNLRRLLLMCALRNAQVPLLQGRKHTWYAGAYTLFNTHEIATMSGEFIAFSEIEAQLLTRGCCMQVWLLRIALALPIRLPMTSLRPNRSGNAHSWLHVACMCVFVKLCSSPCDYFTFVQFDTYLKLAHGPFARRTKA